MSLSAPLRGGVLAVERVLELNDMAVPLAQKILLLGVVLHQLGQRRKLLPPIQVVVVARVLDLNVGHLIVTPKRKNTHENHTCKQRKVDSLPCLYFSLVGLQMF